MSPLCRRFANPLQRLFHVPPFGVRLPDTKPQRQAIMQPRMANEQLAGTVHAVENVLVDFVAAVMAETDKAQDGRRGQLEARIGLDPTANITLALTRCSKMGY